MLKQQEKIKNLLQLIQENPEFEILPMVETEVVGGDDYSWWAGSWGKARLDEAYFAEEMIYFKSHSYDSLVDEKADELWDSYSELSNDELYEKAKAIVDGYEWKKIIVVRIETP